MSAMELLPDDVLVEVLQYVDVPDLLRCRLVCKRLQALVRDGRVWRHREVHLDGRLPNGRVRVPAASPRERGPLHLLSLAPCLDHLYLCAAAGTLRALTTTKCAVASLTLYDYHLSFDTPLYAQVISHQEALGRLRSVHLICTPSEHTSGVGVWNALSTCPRLESLTCNYSTRPFLSPRPSTALFTSPVAPSLRKFSWHLTAEEAPLVHAMLAEHSATLEDVELRVLYIDCSGWTDDTVGPMLGALPKLHTLRLDCPSVLDLPAVAACGTLRKLCVDSTDSDPAVVELLRRAKQLRDVRLLLHWSELKCEVLEALASPGLERLELKFYGITEVQTLLRALPALPALRHLVLDDYYCTLTMVRDLLLGITPATAPALGILELKVDGSPCPHSWVHEDAVYRALITNPLLHIQLEFRGLKRCFKSACVECAKDCHKDICTAQRYLKVFIHLDKLQLAVSSRILLY